MQLHTGDLFWDETRKETDYLTLDKDDKATVLVLGGGMSGAMVANELCHAGHDVIVVDKQAPGLGSSDGNTGIIQYCSDMPLDEMIEEFGEQRAVDFYRFSQEGMQQLDRFVKRVKQDVGYRPGKSLFLAVKKEGVQALKKTCEALNQHGFPAELVSKQALKKDFGLVAEGAMRTDGDANLNPYKLVQALHQDSMQRGARVYKDAEVTDIKHSKSGVTLTANGHKLKGDYLVLCSGYAPGLYPPIEKGLERHTTFSFITAPIEGEVWGDEDMIWDDQEPYTYFRLTQDRRLIAGGRDRENAKLTDEKTVEKETDKIYEKIQKYFPKLQAPVTHRWQSVFGESKDGLPFLGQDPDNKRLFYAYGYGGNGTCYCAMASLLVRDFIAGKPHPLAYTAAWPR